MELGMQHAKVVQGGVGDKKHQVAAERRRLNEAERDVAPALRGNLRHEDGWTFSDYLRAKMFWRVRSLSGLRPLRSQAIFANSRNTLTAFRQRIKLRRSYLTQPKRKPLFTFDELLGAKPGVNEFGGARLFFQKRFEFIGLEELVSIIDRLRPYADFRHVAQRFAEVLHKRIGSTR